jgi:chromosome segregation ATPase
LISLEQLSPERAGGNTHTAAAMGALLRNHGITVDDDPARAMMTLASRYAELKRELEVTKSKLTSARETHDQQRAQFDEERSSLKREWADLRKRLGTLESFEGGPAETRRLKDSLDTAWSELSALTVSNGALTAENARLRAEMADVQGEAESAREKSSHTDERLAEALERLADQQTLCNTLKGDLARARGECSVLEGKVDTGKTEIKALHERLESMRKDDSRSIESRREAEDKIATLEGELMDERRRAANLAGDLEALRATAETLREETSGMSKLTRALREAHEAVDSLHARIKDHETRERALNARCETLERNLRSARLSESENSACVSLRGGGLTYF